MQRTARALQRASALSLHVRSATRSLGAPRLYNVSRTMTIASSMTPAARRISPIGTIRLFSAQPATDAFEVSVPEMGESISEGTIAEWLVAPGEAVEEDQIIAALETDKVTVEVRAERAGVLVERFCEEGETVAVGQRMATIDPSAMPSVKSAVPSSTTPTVEISDEPAEDPAPKKEAPLTPPNPVQASLNLSESGERRVGVSRMRKRIAERLKEAQNTAAILTTFNEADMSALMDLRKEYKEAFEKKHGAKLGFMSAFVKASTVALMEQPEVNGFIDGEDIVYRDYVDISVAVSTPKGLVVPAVRGCENMNFAQIEKTILSLGERAKTGDLGLAEMQGGTFTISNGGVFGSLLSTPILNMPQSAILGMHKIQKRPVVVDDEIVIRPMMYLALSYDHRLIDGREAVTFLRRVKTLIEDPRRLLLEIDL